MRPVFEFLIKIDIISDVANCKTKSLLWIQTCNKLKATDKHQLVIKGLYAYGFDKTIKPWINRY